MDVDPVTESDAVAELAYDALIGSEFERTHGWHVKLMPGMVLDQLPDGWRGRRHTGTYAISQSRCLRLLTCWHPSCDAMNHGISNTQRSRTALD